MPRATVIIVNYNGRDVIGECLESLRKQTFKDFEVIVVDNASGDNSLEIAKKAFPDARVISNQKNLGFAAGNNIGARSARGEYLVLLNYDTAAEPDWLGKLIAPLEKDGRIGAACSRVLFYDRRDKINSVGTFLSVFGITGSLGDGLPAGDFTKQIDLFAPVGAAVAIRKDVYDALGGFDERYFMYDEDVDLGWRIWNLGYRVVLAPDSVIYHKYSMKQKPMKYFFITRNKMWSIWKNSKSWQLLWLIPMAAVSSLLMFVLFVLVLKWVSALELLKGLASGMSLPPREQRRGMSGPMLGVGGTLGIFWQKFKKHFLS